MTLITRGVSILLYIHSENIMKNHFGLRFFLVLTSVFFIGCRIVDYTIPFSGPKTVSSAKQRVVFEKQQDADGYTTGILNLYVHSEERECLYSYSSGDDEIVAHHECKYATVDVYKYTVIFDVEQNDSGHPLDFDIELTASPGILLAPMISFRQQP